MNRKNALSLQLSEDVRNQDIQEAYFINASVQDRRKKLETMVLKRNTNIDNLLQEEKRYQELQEQSQKHSRAASQNTSKASNHYEQFSRRRKASQLQIKQFSSC